MLLALGLSVRHLVCVAQASLAGKTPHGNPLPSRVHDILSRSVTAGRRVLLVGDVHGCYQELQDLLAEVGYQPGSDVLIQVGDLVNKGPDSIDVLRFFASTPLAYAVRGNHDDNILGVYRRMSEGALTSNDVSRLQRGYAWVHELDEELATFLSRLPLSLRLPAYGALVVHAGVVPGMSLFKTSPRDLLTMRNVALSQEVEAPAAAAKQAAAEPEAAPALEPAGDAPAYLPGSSGSSDGGDSDDGGGSSSPASAGGSGSAAAAADQRGLDWRGALLAYAQLGDGRRKSQQRSGSQENRAPLAGQQGQQQPGSRGCDASGSSSSSTGEAGSSSSSGSGSQPQELVQALQRPRDRGLRVVAVNGHSHGHPWARVWSTLAASQQRDSSSSGDGDGSSGGAAAQPLLHVFFGHDAKRLLQLESHATGLDGGCVYGGRLYCCILPPLDESGAPMLEAAAAPADAERFELGSSGLPAFLASVPARQQWVRPGK